MARWLLALAVVLGVAPAQERAPGERSALHETERIRHVLSRLTFGPTPALVEQVRAQGLDAWLERQLAADLPEPEALTDQLGARPALEMDGRQLLAAFRTRLPANATAEQRREHERLRQQPVRELKDAVLLRAVLSSNQVLQVACDFFRNHLNVDSGKDDVRFLVPDWEREVIAAGALGRFGELLHKSARHPAMLLYLDNALSRRPLSAAELREVGLATRLRTGSRERGQEQIELARQRGLNENYARELLELHTLGVDNEYAQRDVVELAKVLTGWTVQLDPKAEVGFRFAADMHCPGEKWLLGQRIAPSRKDPAGEGEQVLRQLAGHRGTARFLAWKLCRHLVHDDPPPAMVERIAATFRRSKGDLREVLRALVRDPELCTPRAFQAKLKRPLELVASALRVTGAEITATEALHRVLATLNEPIYECAEPTGYQDQAEAWQDPGVMVERWRFALDLAHGRLPGVRVPPALYDGLHPRIARAWPEQLAARILPAGLSAHTRATLDRAVQEHLRQHDGERAPELQAQLLGLLLGSPEFQRQ